MFNTNIKSIRQLIQIFSTEDKCIKYLEELLWRGIPVSPYDSKSKVYKCKNGRYLCKNTKKYFNVKTGTIYARSKVPLQTWFLAIFLLTSHKKGISSIQLGKLLGVEQKTAWRMAQKIRKCFGIENENKLDGIVECDETFIGGKNKNRHKDKKVKHSQGRSWKDKSVVMGIVQRDGKMTAKVIQNTKRESIQPLIYKYVKRNTLVLSDEWMGYDGIEKEYERKFIDHSKKEYVNLQDSTIHTNNIEGSWKILKDTIRTYNWVSKKFLQNYINEFVFRYNTRNITDGERFEYLLLNSQINYDRERIT